MHNLTSLKPALRNLGVAASAVPVALILLTGCGSDDESTTTTTDAAATSEATTTVASGTDTEAFPSEAFCSAQADLSEAQDGAQRNTAIGEMQAELGEDAPSEVSDALDTLLTGDLTPEQYTDAENTLADVCN